MHLQPPVLSALPGIRTRAFLVVVGSLIRRSARIPDTELAVLVCSGR